ncbi:320_t:CDS:2 [Cetraspora pellucida]|uniref:320_t:CDS:1 n=1 Tax=Cetraspora pellucida TaxID=1433469 RepID=A0A9N9AUR1_9GLOM|nr:320_t:CDS:2 [Cetraspora pellucida]
MTTIMIAYKHDYCSKKSNSPKIEIQNPNNKLKNKFNRTTQETAIKSALKVLYKLNPPSIRAATSSFSLSETTLRCVFKTKSVPDCSSPATVLSSYEEEQLVGYYINMQRLGFGLTRSEVNHCVMNIVNSDSLPQALSKTCIQKANPTIIKDHFDKLNKIIQDNLLTSDCIWNMDETGFVIVPKVEKVITIKGSHQIHKVAHRNLHDHISVVPTILIAGDYILPLIIYKSVHAILSLLYGALSGMVIGFSDSGYMHEKLFQMYIKHFISSITPHYPILLILDGHNSHINYISVNFCHENGILLYALLSYMTHILQLFELPFAILKTEYSKNYDQFYHVTSKLVTKYTFAKMFGPVFIKTYTPATIANAFRATGI